MTTKIIDITDKQKQELEELVNLLGSIKGRHTELVTVYIPAGFNLSTVTRQLEYEKSMAANIKSKQTRTAVTDSLERIIRELKNYKQTPPNGLAIFCGNISEKEGVQDIQLWFYQPPKQLNNRLYHCDQTFIVEPLKEILEIKDVYGLVVMDRREATIGVLEGKNISVLRKLTSGVPGKIKAGGQCLSSDTMVIEKNRGEIKIKDVRIGDLLEGIDLDTIKPVFNKCLNKWPNKKDTLLIITNNEHPSSHINSSHDHLFYTYNEKRKIVKKVASKLKEGNLLIGNEGKLIKILSIDEDTDNEELIDIEVENNNFFANGLLVHNSAARFERITEGAAKEFYRRIADGMKECFFNMTKLKGILIGGPIPTKEEFLEQGELVTALKNKIIAIKDLGYTDEHGLELLVEESGKDIAQQELIKEKKIIEKFFETLGKSPNRALYGIEKVKIALERGAVSILLISKKLPKNETKELEKMAENIGAETKIISTENQDGVQFYNITKGVGAILRFAIE